MSTSPGCFSLRVLAILCWLILQQPMWADLIPPGHKRVSHQLMFIESDELAKHRLIAAPIAGFQGVAEIKPNVPFNFSSKYGTRLYLVPADAEPIKGFDTKLFSQWRSTEPPVNEKSYLPQSSSVESIITKLRLVEITEAGPKVELVEQLEYGAFELPISQASSWQTAFASAGLGLLLLLLFVVWKRKRSVDSPPSSGLVE